MKTVKSKADLTRLAMIRGATVKLANGGMVNASGARAAFKRPEPKPAEPVKEAPAKEKEEEKEESGEVAEAVLMLAHQQAALTRVIADHLARVPPPAAYQFEITRDEDGFMKRVVATPV